MTPYEIAVQRHLAEQEIKRLTQEYNAAVAMNKRKVIEAQMECNHAETKEHAGVDSGDRYTECLLCGKELR